MVSDRAYREAVTEHSPGLPRLAATLGTELRNERNPNGVVTVPRLRVVSFHMGTARQVLGLYLRFVVDGSSVDIHHDVRSWLETQPRWG